MRYRSRSRHNDSGDRYKGHRSHDSSRRHKSKETHSYYSTENRKIESSKPKRIIEKTRYDARHDSESDDKLGKKRESSYDKDYKKSKNLKYERNESSHEKRSHKPCDYTHSYRRNSSSSENSNGSYTNKRKDDKYDYKKSYKKESKRNEMSRSVSSEHSEVKIKQEAKEKKDKKLKKKNKKYEKEKTDKKKKKKQKQSSDEEKNLEIEKSLILKQNIKKVIKKEPIEEISILNKETKLKPFTVKETAIVKNQFNVLNSSNSLTKDVWQKEKLNDETLKNKESSKGNCNNKPSTVKKEESSKDKYSSKEVTEIKKTESLKGKLCLKEEVPNQSISVEHNNIKEEKTVKKIKPCDADNDDLKRNKKLKNSKTKVTEKTIKNSKERDVDNHKCLSSKSNRREKSSHSHSKSSIEKSKFSDYNDKRRRDCKTVKENKCSDHIKKYDDYLSEDERLELPRTPTDAQFAGLLTRLKEESVSDTDIEDIIPPMLLDNRMNALLDNDPNAMQEAWDSEDDVLLNKRENLIAPKHRGVLETLSVPWKILIEEASITSKSLFKNDYMYKYEVSNMLTNMGVSQKLAGNILHKKIVDKYSNIFLKPIPLIHQSLLSQKIRRNTLFRERELFAGALSAKKDFFIRKMLIEQTI